VAGGKSYRRTADQINTALSDNGRDVLAGNDQVIVRDEILDGNGKTRAIAKADNIIQVLGVARDSIIISESAVAHVDLQI
jgi:hypothetical protein